MVRISRVSSICVYMYGSRGFALHIDTYSYVCIRRPTYELLMQQLYSYESSIDFDSVHVFIAITSTHTSKAKLQSVVIFIFSSVIEI